MKTLSAYEVLTTTRTVRNRLDVTKPVNLDTVLECIDIALQAPVGGNRQRWRWLVITDADVRASIARIYRDAVLEPFEAARDNADNEASRHAYQSALHLAEILGEVPVIVVPCQEGRVDDASITNRVGFYSSIIPAVWSLQLALRMHGLGSAYTTAGLVKEAEIASLLGIPADVSQVAIIPIAQTIGSEFRPAKRQPATEVTYVNAWGSALQ